MTDIAPSTLDDWRTARSAPQRMLMLSGKQIALFFASFLVPYALLMAPWPGWREAYATYFRAGGNLLLGRFGSDGFVRFRTLASGDADRDTELLLKNRRTQAERGFAVSSRTQGYNPTAFLIALIVATPIPWRRRLWALFWGVVVAQGYALCRVVVFLLSAFTEDNSLALWIPGSWTKGGLEFLQWVVVTSFAGWLLLPLPLWALVSFRRSDWERLVREADD